VPLSLGQDSHRHKRVKSSLQDETGNVIAVFKAKETKFGALGNPKTYGANAVKRRDVLEDLDFPQLLPKNNHKTSSQSIVNPCSSTISERTSNRSISKSLNADLTSNQEFRSVETIVRPGPSRQQRRFLVTPDVNELQDLGRCSTKLSSSRCSRSYPHDSGGKSPATLANIEVVRETPKKDESSRNRTLFRHASSACSDSPDPLARDPAPSTVAKDWRVPQRAGVIGKYDRNQMMSTLDSMRPTISPTHKVYKAPSTYPKSAVDESLETEPSPQANGLKIISPHFATINANLGDSIRIGNSEDVLEEMSSQEKSRANAHIPPSTFIHTQPDNGSGPIFKNRNRKRKSLSQSYIESYPLKAFSHRDDAREVADATVTWKPVRKTFPVVSTNGIEVEIFLRNVNRLFESTNGTRVHLVGPFDNSTNTQYWYHLEFKNDETKDKFVHKFKDVANGSVTISAKLE